MTLSDRELLVLADLYRLRAAPLGHLAELHADDGDRKKGYALIRRLAQKGLVRIKTVAWDRRQRCVVLTEDGYWIGADAAGLDPVGAYRRPNRLETKRLVKASEFYCAAVRAGLPREHILGRRQLLGELGLQPRDVPLMSWLVDGAGGRWGVHILWKRRNAPALERGIFAVSSLKVPYHAAVYMTVDAFRRARDKYVQGAPSSGLHLFTPEVVPRWAAWVAEGKGVEEDLGPTLLGLFPGALILPPPWDSPAACLVRHERDWLVVDMRFNRVGAVWPVARRARAGLEGSGWGQEVLFVFADRHQLFSWARRLGDWAWAAVEGAPELYRICEGKPVPGREA
jgi:hypothetical protein